MINLMHGDCLDLMKEIPDESINMILTDPPYGMEYRSNRRKKRHKYILGDTGINMWIKEFIDLAYRKMAQDSSFYCFCSRHNIDVFIRNISDEFKIKNILIWNKMHIGMGDLAGSFAPKYEFIIFAVKGRPLIQGKRDSDIIECKRTNNNLHPTQKPVQLLEYLMSKFSQKNDLILDPFMGSGSTGVACVNTNRNFIGIEKDDDYFKIAQDRINQAEKDIKLDV